MYHVNFVQHCKIHYTVYKFVNHGVHSYAIRHVPLNVTAVMNLALKHLFSTPVLRMVNGDHDLWMLICSVIHNVPSKYYFPFFSLSFSHLNNIFQNIWKITKYQISFFSIQYFKVFAFLFLEHILLYELLKFP